MSADPRPTPLSSSDDKSARTVNPVAAEGLDAHGGAKTPTLCTPSQEGAVPPGYNWEGSYGMLRDAIEEHLGAFVSGGEEAEEHLYVEAIEKVAAHLARMTAKAFPGSFPPSSRAITEDERHELDWLRDVAMHGGLAYFPERAAKTLIALFDRLTSTEEQER